MTDAQALPNYRRPEVDVVVPDLTMIADILGGTRVMHTKAATYIKKWPAEEPDIFKFRSTVETVFEGLGRTLSAATGMLFSKSPQITWNKSEATITPHYDNLDNAGTKGSVLVKRFAEMALRDGLAGNLVDHTPAPLGEDGNPVPVVTNKLAADFGLRPTWALYARCQIINWRTTVINNARTLSLISLHEAAEVADGEYGIKAVHRWRVLKLILTPNGWQATWRLFQSERETSTEAGDFRVVGSGAFRNKAGQVAEFLPFSVAYTGRTDAPMTATIPLLGVAWANLAHWQQSTDLRCYRMVSAYPQPVVTGELQKDATGMAKPLRLGPFVAVYLSDAAAKFGWAEITGTSMEQLEKGIAEKLGQMSVMGMSFMQKESRGVQTAEATRLNATAENSTLATASQGIEDAINLSFEHHAWFVGIEKKDAPVMAINREFESTLLDAQTMLAYVTACKDAGLPIRVMLEMWDAGGRLPPGTDIVALEDEMMANAEAAVQRLADANAAQAPPPSGNGKKPTKMTRKDKTGAVTDTFELA